MKTYRHLTKEERCVIFVLRRRGLSLRDSALETGRSAATISREFRRNLVLKQYHPLRAEGLARVRRRDAHRRKRMDSPRLRRILESWLRRKWSPKIIAGRLAKRLKHPVVCHEAIYQWIYTEAQHLRRFLPRRHHQRRPRHIPRWRQEIPDRVHVSQRPPEATDRRQAGHWESDLVVGPGRSALSVSVERKSRYARLRRTADKSAQASFDALSRAFAAIPPALRLSITYDNGKENTLHREVNQRLGFRSFFCAPHASWEKPVVENTNGLIRWHFPKRTNFDMISDEEIQRVERWLNHRPRKCLGFSTPAEALRSARVALTC